jgi:zinc protease
MLCKPGFDTPETARRRIPATPPARAGVPRLAVGAVTVAALLALLAGAPGRSDAAAVERVTLGNGVTVLAKQDASSDIAGVKVLIRVGQEYEMQEAAGIRTLIGEMMLQSMRERLRESAELEPLRRQQDAAPDRVLYNTGTHWGFASVHGAVTSDALPDCLRFLAWAVFESEFTQEQLVQARDALDATRARSVGSDPVRQTYLLLRKALTGEGKAAVSLLGTKDGLAEVSLADVVRLRERLYVLANTYVGIVSPLAPADAVALARDAFEALRSGPRPTPPQPLAADAAQVEVQGSTQLLRLARRGAPPPASIMVGAAIPPVSGPDAVVAEVINAVLGRPGGALDRDKKLAKALALPQASRLRPVQTLIVRTGAVAPHMAMHVFCSAYSIDEAKNRLLEHLKQLRTEPVKRADLDDAKAFVINQSARDHETKLDQAELLAKWELLGAGYEYDESFARRVMDVKPQDIQRVAERYFDRPAVAVQLPAAP